MSKIVLEMLLKMDMWTNRQLRSFIGITCHYILNWKIESVILACNRYKGRHTAERIYQEYEDTVLSLSFGIADKVRHVVTDTARNIVKAFRIWSRHSNCQVMSI